MKFTVIAACLLAATGTVRPCSAQEVQDGRLAGDVARTIRACPPCTIFDHVDARLEGSAVVLAGRVTTPVKKAEIEQQVARIDGVRSVRNDILVLPPLAADDDLRQRVARAIYRNPAFWSYAALSDPPIHIIVERGQVTLRGRVGSQAERTMAGSLATGLGERSVVNELTTGAM